MNSYLKEIAGVREIEKELTVHIVRHTFVTNLTLKDGFPIETVNIILGNINLRIIKRYDKFLNKKFVRI